MQKTYNILSAGTILILIIWIMISKGCNTTLTGEKPIVTKTKIVRDTVLITTSDTIYQERVQWITKTEIVAQRDTILVIEKDTVFASVFEGMSRDSAIDIQYFATVEGRLLDMRLNYFYKKPLRVTSTSLREIMVESHTQEIRYKYGLYVGGSAGFSLRELRPSASLGGLLTTPNGWAYGAEYDFLNSAPSISLYYRLGALFGR